jgi:hypothetical protein
MTVAQIKLELFREIDNLKPGQLKQLYSYLLGKSKTKNDFWNELSREQKADIEAGLKDLDTGRKKNFHSVIAKYR